MKHATHLLVLVCFVVGLMAPACGFAWGGNYSVVEICTANGIESKVVESGDDPDAPTPHSMAEKCPFCLQKTKSDALAVDANTVSHAYAAHSYKIAALHTQFLKEQLYTAHTPRGPPASI